MKAWLLVDTLLVLLVANAIVGFVVAITDAKTAIAVTRVCTDRLVAE